MHKDMFCARGLKEILQRASYFFARYSWSERNQKNTHRVNHIVADTTQGIIIFVIYDSSMNNYEFICYRLHDPFDYLTIDRSCILDEAAPNIVLLAYICRSYITHCQEDGITYSNTYLSSPNFVLEIIDANKRGISSVTTDREPLPISEGSLEPSSWLSYQPSFRLPFIFASATMLASTSETENRRMTQCEFQSAFLRNSERQTAIFDEVITSISLQLEKIKDVFVYSVECQYIHAVSFWGGMLLGQDIKRQQCMGRRPRKKVDFQSQFSQQRNNCKRRKRSKMQIIGLS
ncbi:hypothetical protein PHYBLDRAFT_73176 [Phycomyces blakesleeanus NRRL 1555(-)]|uniref:Uncharacterized protein n=1 Tax=Phycomyces blakesleeanus (strain ATCC 8743b / DSM 1359 / FGSC 10004 / NBRC 33097 / NRRL 1555) TaxID=763407 RepID=A0A162T335_PHYB8|nr:hypothetical protein PHYBLDRAFT_73176 [Phycomyces blakesleeanus NRRL 1555(-)]OAD65892.1 hypothetical protein PHYBLDRAFT_73176 [Phycomyces blakesleeanus NRRL 1555(-)]|eukprot:XP_018283932.1 hypothetical protein PHYBLDRAFT_73176 [Phycomyces blakesleeanus NRRL 1555(-)]